MMKRWLLTLLTLGAVIAVFLAYSILLDEPPPHTGVAIEAPWARAPVTQDSPAAAYMILVNQDDQSDRILEITSPMAARIEIHESTGSGMVPVPQLEIPPRARVALAPGGLHLMLSEFREPLTQGARLQLELRFERAGLQRLEIPVEDIGAMGPAHDHQDHHGHH